MSAAQQSSNEIQTLRAQLATAEQRIQRYNDIIISQAEEMTVLRNNLCEIPALRAQLAGAERRIQHYNDLIIAVLRNNLCCHCRNKSSTPVATASARSFARLTTLNPDTAQIQVRSVTSPSLVPAIATSSSQSSVDASPSKSDFYDAPQTFSASDTPFSCGVSVAKPKSTPKTTQSPVRDFPKQVDSYWPIANNPTAKSVLRLTFLRSFNFDEAVTCLKFSPDGKSLAIGLADRLSRNKNGKGFIYDAETGTRTSVLEEFIEKVKSGFHSICFNPTGELFAVGHHDGHISVWTIREKRIRNMFRGHTGTVTSLEFSPNGRHVISASRDHTFRVWNMRNGSSRIFMHIVFPVRFSPNGNYFAAGCHDGSLVIWCLRSGKRVEKWMGHCNIVSTLAFMPDGKGLVSGSWDHKVRQWGVDSPDVRRTGTKPEALGLTPKIAPTEGKQAILELDGHLSHVNSLAISPDGKWVLSGSNDQTARIWDARTGVHQWTLLGNTNLIRSVDFSAEGNYLAISGIEGRVGLWKYGT